MKHGFIDVIFLSPSRVFLFWFAAFLYALLAGVVLQTLVLPMMPSLHAGHGLMVGDGIFFHEQALYQVELIREGGWHRWSLIPSAASTGNVGILAALYALFGPQPLLFLPLNAAFHALGCVLVLLIAKRLFPGKLGTQGGWCAALFFLLFPSALVWYGQVHKDGFAIAGYLMLMLAVLRGLQSQGWLHWVRTLLLFVAGFYLVGIMRPHMPMIYMLALLGALCMALVFYGLRRDGRTLRALVPAAGLVLIGVLLTPTISVDHRLLGGDEQYRATEGAPRVSQWQWERSNYLPLAVDGRLEMLASVRAYFIAFGQQVAAGSSVDETVRPQNAAELVAYLPRALQIGVFAPFPSFWVEHLSAARVIGAVETLVFYLCLPGLLWALWRKMSVGMFIMLSAALAIIMLNSFVSPNIGTLHRIRFGQWYLLMLVGICGSLWLVQSVFARRQDQHATAQALPLPSGSQAASAGMLVMLVTLLGFLGLLVRDLLLIDRVGFGLELDSYYLAMMLPMFLSAVLALPLADALASRFAHLGDPLEIRRLLRGASTLTLLLFLVLSAVLWCVAKPVFSLFIAGQSDALVLKLFPLALLLLVFAGMIAAGNSLLNSVGRPVWAACAQLVVSVVVVVSVLLADRGDEIFAAMLGMVLGQLANLLVLMGLLWRQGYSVWPGSLAGLASERSVLSNVQWLALCALLVSVAVPVNYWFAGTLGEGSVSTWALGSKLVQVASVLGAALMTAVFVPYMSRIVASGSKGRVRDDLFTSLVMGSWGCALVVLAVFVFAEPLIYAAGQSVDEVQAAERLVLIVKLGALQLPVVMAATLLFKFCAVSSVSLKAVLSALMGLVINVFLNLWLVPLYGLVGLAMAWTLSSLAATLMAMALTQGQSHLSVYDMLMVVMTWLVLCLLAVAIHWASWPVAGGALLGGAGLLRVQMSYLTRLPAAA
jgi:putative peptidoglycan lipid II flippase